MALSKLALAGLGLGTAAVVAKVISKPTPTKRKRARGGDIGKLKTKFPGPDPDQDSGEDHPICKKYPQGHWLEGYGWLDGFPKDKPGWSTDDVKMVHEMVDKRVASAPAWESLADARQIAFEITQEVVGSLCPSLDIPPARYNVSGYLKQGIGFRYLWTQVEGLAWNKLVGAPGGGDN